MKFRSPTDQPIRVATTDGHVILIGPELREVPNRFVKAAVAEGAIPEGVPVELMQSDKDTQPKADDRDAVIRRALTDMVEAAKDGSGAPDEFTANGLPSVGAVSKRAGFKVSREEAYAAWHELNDDGSDGGAEA